MTPAMTPSDPTPSDPTPADEKPFDPRALRYNADGLVPAVAQQHDTGEVLMLAWMSAASIERSLAEGRVVYWSRSRQEFWRKGDTSGHVQRLIGMRVDCDRDCLLLLVDQTGAACHLNRRSCFFTAVETGVERDLGGAMAD